MTFIRLAALALTGLLATPASADTGALSRDLFANNRITIETAANALADSGDKSAIPAIILAMRFQRGVQPTLISAYQALSGDTATSWFDAMLWQEDHPEIRPHESYIALKQQMFRRIDPQFDRFVGGDRARPENMRIRLEEITWGGVQVDGIPALDNPRLIPASAADYLKPDDLVFGVEINGDARAYPLRIMGWHEMFNDVIGGVPVSLAYCTLCGAGVLFEGTVPGYQTPFTFGSSGFLYRSNKLMYDRQTDSLWNQFTGEPVMGPLVRSGITLTQRPVATTTWESWRRDNPQTRVLSLDTGFSRDYGSGVVYSDYFASDELMFPSQGGGKGLAAKDRVFGVRVPGGSKAWPVKAFTGGRVINDAAGFQNLVLIGDAETRTVRAYDRGDRAFSGAPGAITGPGGVWRLEEDALIGPYGERAPRVAGHLSYWFAWESYLGADSELFTE